MRIASSLLFLPLGFSLCLFFALCLLASAGAVEAHADSLQTFSLDSTTVAGTSKTLDGHTLSVTLDDISIAGVTFDATLTVTGSGSLTQTSSGLGVSGTSSNLFNAGEKLKFFVDVDAVRGGTVTFAGFTLLDFNFFTTGGETVVFSTDGRLSTTTDNWLTHFAPGDADIRSQSPTVFTLLAQNGLDASGGVVKTSLRVDAIQASFETTAAVPEPGTFALVGLVCASAWLRRRLRRRRDRV